MTTVTDSTPAPQTSAPVDAAPVSSSGTRVSPMSFREKFRLNFENGYPTEEVKRISKDMRELMKAFLSGERALGAFNAKNKSKSSKSKSSTKEFTCSDPAGGDKASTLSREDLAKREKEFMSAVTHAFAHSIKRAYNTKRRKRSSGKESTNNPPFKKPKIAKQELIDFAREATQSHPDLGFFSELSLLQTEGRLAGTCNPNSLTQFFNIYFLVHGLKNPECGQLIRPDALMRKYFGTYIDDVLTQELKNDKLRDLCTRYPGEIPFVNIQKLNKFLLDRDASDAEDVVERLEHPDNTAEIDRQIQLLKDRNRELRDARSPPVEQAAPVASAPPVAATKTTQQKKRAEKTETVKRKKKETVTRAQEASSETTANQNSK